MDYLPLTPEYSLDLWYLALQEEFGLALPVASSEDVTFIMNRLYDARNDIGDPRLKALSMHIVESGKEILIYKKEVDLED